MEKISTIGLDLAKSVFQVHGVNNGGQVVLERKLRRGQVLAWFAKLEPCLIDIEACGTAHYWARELQKLGHEVRLIPPAYAKPMCGGTRTMRRTRRRSARRSGAPRCGLSRSRTRRSRHWRDFTACAIS